MLHFLEWLQATPLSVAIAEKWFPLVESFHVITIALVAGTIFIVDTRLLGLTSTRLPFTYVSDRLLPWTWVAFASSAVTGTLMFIGNATAYYTNVPFRIKLVLLVLAGLNMAFFQMVTFRGVASWNSGRPPGAARAGGFISIALWCGVIAFGRWIGFVA
jgi:hypothetical protein